VRNFVVTVAIGAAAVTFTPTAVAHHEVQLPKYTQQQAVKLHPAFRAKLQEKGISVGRDQLKQGRARDGKVVWSKVKEQTGWYWAQLHPKSDEYLNELWRRTGDHLLVIRKTWDAIGVSPERQQFYYCAFGKEGGYDHMDVMFGGNRVSTHGLPPGNAVLSPGQIRPAWVTVWEHGGFYRQDYWTWHKVHLITHPVTNAKITAMINPNQWAATTKRACGYVS